jgi:hypothetical protein
MVPSRIFTTMSSEIMEQLGAVTFVFMYKLVQVMFMIIMIIGGQPEQPI